MEGENQFNRNEQSTGYLSEENEYKLQDHDNVSVDRRPVKEKMTVVLVLITSFFAVILGVTQFSSSLKKPFTQLMLSSGIDNDYASDALTVLAQQQKDTDNDGFSDYDELNVYSTSPYLADSDSDGISDKEEVDAGHDPNCPGSDTCFRTDVNLNQNTNQSSQPNMLAAQSDPKILRELLIQNGFPKAQLDTITDEQLLITYQQAIAGQNPTVSGNVNVSGGIDSIDDLKNLTGAQIRTLLISQGAPQEILSQVSDEELKAMFLTKLNASSN